MDRISATGMPDDRDDSQYWNISFLGGSVDRDDTLEAVPEAAAVVPSSGPRLPLAMTAVGDRVWVVQVKGGRQLLRRLTDMGIVQGRELTIVSRAESGSVIVALPGCRIGLGAGMAHRVVVTTALEFSHQTVIDPVNHPFSLLSHSPLISAAPTRPTLFSGASNMPTTSLPLGTLGVGQSGRIVGYERGHRGYREKLLSMGLTPGTELTVTRQAPMGDPIEVEVRGFKLSLRKAEAAMLRVETIAPEEVQYD